MILCSSKWRHAWISIKADEIRQHRDVETVKNIGVVNHVLHFKTVFTETFTINMANEMYSL